MLIDEELGACQHVIPIMNELLASKGVVRVAETKVYVAGLNRALETGW
jgi:hypothetical protein